MGKLKAYLKTLSGRLLIGAIVPVVALIVIGLIANSQSKKLGSLLEEGYGTIAPNLKSTGEILYYRGNVGIYAGAGLAEQDPEKRKAMIEAGYAALDSYKSSIRNYEEAPFLPGEEEMYKEAKAHKEKFEEATIKMFSAIEKKTAEGDKEAMGVLYGDWISEAKEIRLVFEKITKMYGEYTITKDEEQKESRKKADFILFASAGGFGIFVLIYLLFLARSVSKSVASTTSGLTDSSGEITLAIEALSTAGHSLSASSTQAAASLEETVASLEEITSMVRTNSDHAKEAAGLSQSSCEIAQQGEAEIQKLIQSMTEISQSSRKIEEIINVIDDIAFQTNLLALNAAVEAARAGEQGKGFAVVAEAVRALAQRSASAAKDISNLIKESVEKIDRGSEVAGKSGAVLNNIVTSVKKVSSLNDEISTASEEQTRGVSQISGAMNQLDQIAQTNAASSEEIASTSSEISSQAKTMMDHVNSLNELVGRKTNGSSEPVKAKAKVETKEVEKNAERKEEPAKAPVKATSSWKPKILTGGKSAPKPAASKPKSAPAPARKVAPVAKKPTPVAAKPAPKAEPVAKSKVSSKAAELIPFDDDVLPAKVGNTDGF